MSQTGELARPVLAIDLGGTKIIAAIISGEGRIIAREYCLTLADQGPELVINRMLAAADHLLGLEDIAPSQLAAISIAPAGIIDIEKGVITLSPNLSAWRDIPLRSIVAEKYRVETLLINDASAAALGEHHLGAGQGVSNLIYLTVSTGIGGGIIIDDRLYLGASGGAGEIGHMIIEADGPRCSCGISGCLEALASGTAVAREAMRRIGRGEQSSLGETVAGKLADITAEQVSLAAQAGDSLALEVITQAMAHLGTGVVNLVNIFNPEMIVIGGGMAKMGDLLFAPVRQAVQEKAFPLLAEAVRIVPAQLGDDAGVCGAALFAFERGAGRAGNSR